VDKIAITVDYEFDWGGRVNSTYAIEKMTDKVLKILDDNHAKSTFFISTETASKTKKNILDIYNAGHEIASHGHNHNVKYDLLSKDKLEYEIRTSKDILEDLISGNIYGFRTPQFRKNRYTEELLLKHNYTYDSSSVDTNFLDRYKKNQFQDGELKNFSVSSLFDKIPAGLKWINLVGNHIKDNDEIKIIYLHLFDLLSMKDILALYDKRAISKIVLLFYIARTTSLLKTLELNCNNSILLKDEINV
jgi:peptidoglycan/xylan/chitin deacetylase (PgdA/CDA1 family)